MFEIENLWRFAVDPGSYGELLTGTYYWEYVAASLLIAALATFATLLILDKVKSHESSDPRSLWLLLACFTLSLGVWTMHFTGMIAFVMSREMDYDPWITAASVIPMLLGSWAAIKILRQPNPSWRRIQCGSLFLALGIGSMHYLGMEAMQIEGVNIFYNPWIFLASIFIAHGLACVVVYTYGLGEKLIPATLLKPVTALLMSVAISSMHYTAMAAASYVIDTNAVTEISHAGHGWLPIAVLTISTLILSSIAVISFMDNKLEHSNKSLARVERLILRSGTMAGIGGWELQNGELFTTSHLTKMLPALENRDTDKFLKIVDPLNLASNSANAVIGEQFSQNIEVDGPAGPLIFHSQCELIVPGHLFGYLQDITESMNREKALDAARRLAEDAANARSEFVANMSHELRTPMNGVLGMISLLEETKLSEEQGNLLKVAHESGETMLAVVNKVLDFSKLEYQEIPVEIIAFDLERLVCECLNLDTSSALNKNIQLNLRWHPELHYSWMGDPRKIRQALINLISNAIKFTDKGIITVSVSGYQDGIKTGVEISIEDSGVGFTENQLAKIFEPFHQADASTTRKFGGTGLGLSITKRLIDSMDGSMHARSDDKEGSTFTIRIPLQENPSDQKEPPSFENLKIAIVSSDFHLVQETSRTLEYHGAKVEVFSTVSDFDQSDTDGNDYWSNIVLDACLFSSHEPIDQAIKTFSPYANTVVAANHGSSINHHTIIRKPFGPVELLSLIESAKQSRFETQRSVSGPHSSNIQNLQVLLAEDNIVNQKVTMSMLAKLGVQADLAENGREAFDATGNRDYDVILMDMQMPVLDGVEATRAIRKKDISQPWIIAATANASTEDQELCFTAGMNDHLAKPMKVKDLEMALGKALGH